MLCHIFLSPRSQDGGRRIPTAEPFPGRAPLSLIVTLFCILPINLYNLNKNHHNRDHHNNHHRHQKSKKWRRKKKKRAAAAAALARGTHVKQCTGGMVVDVMAALVASEHIHTTVRKHLKRMEVLPLTTGSNNSNSNNNNDTVTAAIFGNPSLSHNDQPKTTKKTLKQGQGAGLGLSSDGVNNTNGGTSHLSGEGVSTIQSLRQVLIRLLLYLILVISTVS